MRRKKQSAVHPSEAQNVRERVLDERRRAPGASGGREMAQAGPREGRRRSARSGGVGTGAAVPRRRGRAEGVARRLRRRALGA